MRRGGRLAVGLGAGALLGGWLFGSIALTPVGVGLVVAGALAVAWRRFVPRGVSMTRTAPAHLTEGEPLRVELSVRRARLFPGRLRVIERVGALGEQEVRVSRGRGLLTVAAAPRGSYALGPAVIELEDLLGLERVTATAPSSGRVVVRPRVVELDRVFTGAAVGSMGADGRPRQTRSGLEPAGIREYRDGEPLRSVHWPSTARRGELMVRELDDSSRDDVVVVLDGDQAGAVGPRGASSFDEAARVAAALVRVTIRAGKRARLVVHGARTASYRAGGAPAEWEALLDGLAVAEADAAAPVHALLNDRVGVTRGVDDAIVVTARPSVGLTRALGRIRRGGLVVIDAATYAGSGRSRSDPVVLRAAASGVPVAVVRRGDDLALALSGRWRERERLGA